MRILFPNAYNWGCNKIYILIGLWLIYAELVMVEELGVSKHTISVGLLAILYRVCGRLPHTFQSSYNMKRN